MGKKSNATKKTDGQPNYLAIFIIGLALEGVSVAMLVTVTPMGIALIGSGICLVAIGLANRDKWHGAPVEGPDGETD